MAINSLSAASHGFSGLVSGINTQEVVEKLLSGTQAKIDKAGQRKTTLQYKQQMYREVATKLRTLQTDFLSFTSKTNLLSSAFYNTMAANITTSKNASARFSVSASSSAKVGNTTVNYIAQLASARTYSTSLKASGKVDGTFNQRAAEELYSKYTDPADAKLTIKVGDKTVSIENAPLLFGGKGSEEIATLLTQKMRDAGVEADARFVNNKLSIIADDPDHYIVVQGNQSEDSENPSLSMKMFGNVKSLSGKGTFTYSINSDNYLPGFTVALDGREQTIRLDLEKLREYVGDPTAVPPVPAGNANALAQDIRAQLKNAFGNGVQLTMLDANGAEITDESVPYTAAGFRLKAGSESQNFSVTGDYNILGTMSLKSGISSKINTNLALKDLNFANGLQGNLQRFTINGVQFSYNSNVSLGKIINDINSSKAGVKITYNESKDKFIMQRSESGAGTDEIVMGQSEGNLLNALFGIGRGAGEKFAASGSSVSKPLVGATITSDVLDAIKNGGRYTFDVNGTKVSFSISRKKDDELYTPETFAEKMNEGFAAKFGKNPEGDQIVSFVYNDTEDRFEIHSLSKDQVISIVDKDPITNKSLLGFTVHDATQVRSKDTTLAETGIDFGTGGGLQINVSGHSTPITIPASALDGSLTLEQVAQKIQDEIQASSLDPSLSNVTVTFDEKTAAFKIAGVDVPMEIVALEGAGSKNLDNLFGSNSLKIGWEQDPALVITSEEGKNAVLSIDGNLIERTSNTFTIDGITYTLNDTTPIKEGTADLPPMPGVPRDPLDPTSVPTEQEIHDYWKNYADEGAAIVGVTRDTETIVEGIREFLKAYNETMDYMYELMKADATYKDYPPLTAKQKEEMSDREIELWEERSKEGLLRGDPTLDKIIQSMRTAMYTKPDDSNIALYDLGISTSYYAKDGNLQENNNNDLKALIEADPEAVQRLFAGTGGIMELLNGVLNDATRISYGNPGWLVAVAGSATGDTSSSIYKQIREIDDQLTTLEDRYWNEYNRYWKQFNSMEQMIQQMNQQSSWLSQQFSGG